MPKADLSVNIAKLNGGPVGARIGMEFRPFSGPLGVGGEPMQSSFQTGQETDFRITGLLCRGGPGTMYRVLATAPHYRAYSFFQSIQEDIANTASDDIGFWVKPGDVRDIQAAAFDDLPVQVQTILTNADMREEKHEDRDLFGLSGAALYQALGPMRKACLLNIARKTADATSDNCLPSIEAVLLCRQDRLFAFTSTSLPDQLRGSATFKSAPESLHDPLDGFALTGDSFKTRDAHANLQVTFMRHQATGRLAADIDIDESSGIEHGFEVIRNALFKKRTNPYLIREFMLSADPKNRSLDPGYEFVF
jgi:hypothetical protein